jgi:hypothetical protein
LRAETLPPHASTYVLTIAKPKFLPPVSRRGVRLNQRCDCSWRYDGDTKSDLAVILKVGTGLNWYILNSQTGQFRAV